MKPPLCHVCRGPTPPHLTPNEHSDPKGGAGGRAHSSRELTPSLLSGSGEPLLTRLLKAGCPPTLPHESVSLLDRSLNGGTTSPGENPSKPSAFPNSVPPALPETQRPDASASLNSVPPALPETQRPDASASPNSVPPALPETQRPDASVSKQCPSALPETQRPADTPACNRLPVVVTSTPAALPGAEPGSA